MAGGAIVDRSFLSESNSFAVCCWVLRAKHQAAGNRLRKLLRSPRLLACEVASVRVGLGNLSATRGESRNAGNADAPAVSGASDVRAGK